MNKVVLVKDGKTAWQILVNAKNEKGFDFAARELQKYIQKMSKGALRIVDKEEGNPIIIISLRKALCPDDRCSLPAIPKGYDGYAILVTEAKGKNPARIIIASENGRGAIYGAYDILEKLGCRWFYPEEDPFDPEVVPQKHILNLQTGSWAVSSLFEHRICNGAEWFFDIDPGKALKQMDWAMKNRYNAMGWQSESKTSLQSQYEKLRDTGLLYELDRRDMFLHGPAHSFDHFLKAEDYMESHPEWFGMRDGKRAPQTFAGAQFCWSNPEARKQFLKNAEDFIKNAPHHHIFCTIPFDGGIACSCDECKKAGASNLLMTITGELIDMMERIRPDAHLETIGGYGPSTDPPAIQGLHPKLRVIWAHWGRYHGYGYDDPRYDRRENLALWRKACRGGITIAQYYTDNFAEPWILPPFAIAIAGDRKYFLETKMDSVYMLMWPKGYWWNHSLNGYLAGRCFYDVSLDPYEILKDYALHYYGKEAGKYIGGWYREWAKNPDLAYRVKDDAQDKHRAMLLSQRRKYIDPGVKAAEEDPAYSYRAAKVEKLHILAERLGEMHHRKDVIRQLRKQGKFNEAKEALKKADAYTDELMEYFYHLADLNQGLMDRKEVPWFIKIKVKDWIEEEARNIEEKKSSGETRENPQQPDETQVLPLEVAGTGNEK
ncbi:DUF4838 domain-containing protein [Candidatus Sumerlaeota bacterium]|nr:DUF4838 domain-containing protein [Candidatus Sumerlaeota bacterium]